MSSILQEVVSVQSNDPCLVRLGNISKNHIHHTYGEDATLALKTLVDMRGDLR